MLGHTVMDSLGDYHSMIGVIRLWSPQIDMVVGQCVGGRQFGVTLLKPIWYGHTTGLLDPLVSRGVKRD